jgi:hypothetical protein
MAAIPAIHFVDFREDSREITEDYCDHLLLFVSNLFDTSAWPLRHGIIRDICNVVIAVNASNPSEQFGFTMTVAIDGYRAHEVQQLHVFKKYAHLSKEIGFAMLDYITTLPKNSVLVYASPHPPSKFWYEYVNQRPGKAGMEDWVINPDADKGPYISALKNVTRADFASFLSLLSLKLSPVIASPYKTRNGGFTLKFPSGVVWHFVFPLIRNDAWCFNSRLWEKQWIKDTDTVVIGDCDAFKTKFLIDTPDDYDDGFVGEDFNRVFATMHIAALGLGMKMSYLNIM